MDSSSGAPVLAERVDVHKSCKSLEVLLNIFNDYCEAAGAIVTLQKKLAKALRETASLKVTGEIAANALNTSAIIFEGLSDIDSKFSKLADKEYDNISAEVKKWFKKLAKDEKTHDDRIASANAKIKQAGQLFEKKSKKNARDASEEHSKYINLISTLGPEISQEKYNHSLQITQRHMSTTYSVAACVSRLADREWLRSCEEVRRFAPSVGQLGEWRALCEGGWTGPIPPDLPDVEDADQEQSDRAPTYSIRPDDQDRQTLMMVTNPQESIEQSKSGGRSPTGYVLYKREQDHPSSPMPTTVHLRPDESHTSPGGRSRSPASTSPTSLDPPRAAFTDENTGSVRSLSAFPSPPTHYPIPPPATQRLPPSQLSNSSSSGSNVSFPVLPRLTESPLSGDHEMTEEGAAPLRPSDNPSSPGSVPPSPGQRFQNDVGEADIRQYARVTSFENEIRKPVPIRSQTLPLAESYHPSISENAVSSRSALDSISTGTREFGVDGGGEYTYKARPIDSARSKGLGRSDTTGGNHNDVAAMRNRLSYRPGATSPTANDVPRLPVSVTNLASRYEPIDRSPSPRTRATSSPISRLLPLPPPETVAQARQAESSFQERSPPGQYRSTPAPGPSTSNVIPPFDDEATRLRRQQLEERVEFELQDKERELREREREIEMRARELERERAKLMNARGDESSRDISGGYSTPQPQLRPHERRTSFKLQQRPRSQLDLLDVSPSSPSADIREHPRYSYSTTHLAPPPLSNNSHNNHVQSQPPSSSHNRSQQQHEDTSEHAPYCGCDSCSIAKYKERKPAPQPHDLRPPEKPFTLRTEKPKGWIRRLSMPVGNAFSLDSKKSNVGYGSGISGKGAFSLDGKKNLSSTALGTRVGRVQEDGRLGGAGRTSYEASGVSSRDSTDLGLSARR